MYLTGPPQRKQIAYYLKKGKAGFHFFALIIQVVHILLAFNI